MEMEIVHLIEKFGFPVVAAGCMGYLIFYLYRWTTTEVKPIISETNTILVALIDRIRTLDNDLIRLNTKINTVLVMTEKIEKEKRENKDENP
jgi:hypothetical protein